MASELTINASLQFAKGNVSAKSLAVQTLRADVTGTDFVQGTQNVGTTSGGEPLGLGAITAPGMFMIKNNDTTNSVNLMPAHSGTPLLTIKAGEIAIGRFASTVTAPEVLASASTVQIEYLLIEA